MWNSFIPPTNSMVYCVCVRVYDLCIFEITKKNGNSSTAWQCSLKSIWSALMWKSEIHRLVKVLPSISLVLLYIVMGWLYNITSTFVAHFRLSVTNDHVQNEMWIYIYIYRLGFHSSVSVLNFNYNCAHMILNT